MAIFNSYVSHYQRVIPFFTCWQYPSICWRQSRNKCRWNPYSSPMNLHVLRNKRPKKQVLSWHLQNSTLLNLNFISKKQKKTEFSLNFASKSPWFPQFCLELPLWNPHGFSAAKALLGELPQEEAQRSTHGAKTCLGLPTRDTYLVNYWWYIWWYRLTIVLNSDW